ncbi:MAG: MurR/RpiR family transcriptional regulator [Clostridia bacterium]|nr:MurR/RpiR family transcriptional regulator [Clostridia bacterium]
MLLEQLRAQRDFLSKVEKKIADVILRDPERFVQYSAIELSAAAGVSQGSINNFSQKFVSGGFSELKRVLTRETEQEVSPCSDAVTEPEGVKDIMRRSAETIAAAFHSTQMLNGEQTLKQVAECIMQARRICICGIFRSGIVAQDFCFQLLKLGLPAEYATDVLTGPITATVLNRDALVIAISSSGRTKEIYETVRIAKENGAATVCITRNGSSPVASLCDHALIVSAIDEGVGGRSALMCDHYLIEAICAYIRSRMDEAAQSRYFKLTDILNSHNMED